MDGLEGVDGDLADDALAPLVEGVLEPVGVLDHHPTVRALQDRPGLATPVNFDPEVAQEPLDQADLGAGGEGPEWVRVPLDGTDRDLGDDSRGTDDVAVLERGSLDTEIMELSSFAVSKWTFFTFIVLVAICQRSFSS